ncbi:hypothetical protein Lser_V15G07327 [Lactuca serriola]
MKQKIFMHLSNGETISFWKCLLLGDSEKILFEHGLHGFTKDDNTPCVTVKEHDFCLINLVQEFNKSIDAVKHNFIVVKVDRMKVQLSTSTHQCQRWKNHKSPSSNPLALTFSDAFLAINKDDIPSGSGPHMFVSYVEECEIAFVANRKNTDQHIVLFGWSSDKNNEAEMIEITNDAWIPTINLQENSDDNLILAEEKLRHEHEQQLEVELSRERHERDLKEKYRLARVMEHKMELEEKVVSRRKAEYDRMRAEREERLGQILKARKEERDLKRKMLFYLKTEKERLNKLREEEEARKREEVERCKKEEAERREQLDEIAERQRKREQELEERERLRKEAILRGTPLNDPTRPF